MRLGLFAIALLAVAARTAAAEPAISILSVPPYGALGSIAGSVTGADPATHHVAAWLYVDGFGWCTKPTSLAPTVPIAPDGAFVADVTTGGLASLDASASLYCAALLPIEAAPPFVCGGPRIPAFEPLAIDCEQRFGRTLAFAGRSWGVKEAAHPVGPGSNVFSLAPEDVFVDASGKLHLTIHGSGDAWRATEVVLLEALGYGAYEFVTESDLSTLDAFATFGGFTWDPHGDGTGAGLGANREIDFEASRWGDAADPDNAQAVVQPWTAPGHLDRFAIPSGTLRWRMAWSPGRVEFRVLDGANELYAWSYTGEAVPTPGRAAFHFNLWPNSAEIGVPGPPQPGAGEPIEVVIADFAFVPEPGALAAVLVAIATLATIRSLRRPAPGGVC